MITDIPVASDRTNDALLTGRALYMLARKYRIRGTIYIA